MQSATSSEPALGQSCSSQIEILDSPSAEPLRYGELLEGNEFLRSYPISMLYGSTVVAPLILAEIQFSHSFL